MATLVEGPFGQTTDFNMGLNGKYETRLGDDVLTESFARTLEQYYDKADRRDQAKCLELLASLKTGQEVRRDDFLVRRPKTAMPELGMSDKHCLTKPYETTYAREYVPRPDPDVRALRPMTSHAFSGPRSAPPVGSITTYQDEFFRKNQRPATPIRSGTASGDRNNKPHPPQSFIVWKLPSKGQRFQPPSPWSEEVTNEKLNQVTKRLCRSVYQDRLLGIPQGYQMKSAFNLPPDWKERVQYSVDSFQRSTYQVPQQQPEHAVPTTRYGASQRMASKGIVPSSNATCLDIRSRTTYDRHYNDNAGAVADQIRDTNRRLEREALMASVERARNEEKEVASKAVEDQMTNTSTRTYTPPPSYLRPPVPTPYRARAVVPAATPITNFSPAHPLLVPSPPPSTNCVPLFLS
ncbi:LOW QUALITY PROTEIN: testis-expressed protein 26-like [Pomacea canaliculata]|uniref:LOW QUALITY PROTEIN: testis-expressed protein 26-like n=1 Tax=Pomacea canaliculata TaxID=400727 RepID=UPI000D736273|nr:LOW QUALITY PROTEIN: testis-expressed protein 26-like [Pomacea canaliculata]